MVWRTVKSVFGHFPELVIVIVIALIVFGPEKLPETAANLGKMVREARSVMDTAMNPIRQEIPDDFSSYYYESLARAGEDVPDSAEVSPPYHNFYEMEAQDASIGGEQEAASGARPVRQAGGSRRMVTRVVQPRTTPDS